MNDHSKNYSVPLRSTAFCLPHPCWLESEPPFLSTPSSLSLFVPELLGLWSMSGTKTWSLSWTPILGLYTHMCWLASRAWLTCVCGLAPRAHGYLGSSSGISAVETVICVGFLASSWAVQPQPWWAEDHVLLQWPVPVPFLSIPSISGC